MEPKIWTPSFHNFLILIVLGFVCGVGEGRSLSEIPPPPSPSKPKVPALYVFGDSLVENGNNNYFFTIAKGDYYPYGIDFPQGATGRFSNGRTVADIISDYLGLPYSPPYVGSTTWGERWFTGFNYASSGCGILPETGMLLGKCLNLDKQIRYFQDTIEWRLKKHYTNATELSEHLSKSIALFVTGNNDYLNNYLNRAYVNEYKSKTPQQFADILLNYLSNQLKKLYRLGVRKVIFSEIAPVGCMPYTSNRTSMNQGVCNETKNEIASVFNQGIEQLFSNLLSGGLQDSKLLVAKNYNLVHQVVNNPTQYGFENSRDACCEATKKQLKCLRGIPPCKKRDQYCFWDGFHPTEAMNAYLISKSLSDNPIDSMFE